MVHIDQFRFGYFIIDGKEYDSDIRIVDDMIEIWHDHGLSWDDVLPAVKAKPEIIIIGTGSSGVVQVSDDIKEKIKAEGIQIIVEKTQEACRIYNDLRKKEKKVAAVLHSTC